MRGRVCVIGPRRFPEQALKGQLRASLIERLVARTALRWDMSEMDGLPVRRVLVAKLVHEPINIMDGRRRRESPGRTCFCKSHRPQAPWIKTLVPSAISLGHIYANPLSWHGKACQDQNPGCSHFGSRPSGALCTPRASRARAWFGAYWSVGPFSGRPRRSEQGGPGAASGRRAVGGSSGARSWTQPGSRSAWGEPRLSQRSLTKAIGG